eukprot:5625441-Heterocapsa_arctica.AAC.1
MEAEATGAMDNDMTPKEEFELLEWIDGNEEMTEATTAEEIGTQGVHLGAIIFDKLIGGHTAIKHGNIRFNLKENSRYQWGPWAKIAEFIRDKR